MPVKQFWALTVYPRATMSFIYHDSNRTTLSSYDDDNMKKNADGGVTIYVGPKAPVGLESNWLPTAGKRPLPAMRFTAERMLRTTKRPRCLILSWRINRGVVCLSAPRNVVGYSMSILGLA